MGLMSADRSKYSWLSLHSVQGKVQTWHTEPHSLALPASSTTISSASWCIVLEHLVYQTADSHHAMGQPPLVSLGLQCFPTFQDVASRALLRTYLTALHHNKHLSVSLRPLLPASGV